MAWPLTWVVTVGTLPGVFLGSWVRISCLPDPEAFKLFVGCVLLYLGVRLVSEFTGGSKKQKAQNKALDRKFKERVAQMKAETNKKIAAGLPADLVLFSARRWSEFLSRPQADRIIVRNGKGIDRSLPDYRDLDPLMKD